MRPRFATQAAPGRPRLICLCALSVLSALVFYAFAAEGGEYYVSPGGNDGNNGSSAAPWRSIGHAVAAARAPGDKVWVHAGTYFEVLNLTQSGSAEQRITFSAIESELKNNQRPVLDGQAAGLGGYQPLVQLSGNYLTFSGFEVKNSGGVCLFSTGSNALIQSNYVHDCQEHGILIQWGNTGGTRAEGNTVHSASLRRTWAGGLVVADAPGPVTVGYNAVYHNWGEGINVLKSRNVLVYRNIAFNNWHVQIYNDNSTDTRIDSNLLYATPNSGFEDRGVRPSGIWIATESYGTSNPSERITIINNIISNCFWNLGYGDFTGYKAMRYVRVINNTFVNAVDIAISMGNDVDHTGGYFANNIVYQNNAQPLFRGQGGFAFENNYWYGNEAGPAGGTADVRGQGPGLVDPDFVPSPGNLDAAKYRLLSSSPCRDHGVPAAEVTKDFFEGCRPANGNPDIGAHELCEPSCAGKTCGDADGCGGSCQSGSGCTEPPPPVQAVDAGAAPPLAAADAGMAPSGDAGMSGSETLPSLSGPVRRINAIAAPDALIGGCTYHVSSRSARGSALLLLVALALPLFRRRSPRR